MLTAGIIWVLYELGKVSIHFGPIAILIFLITLVGTIYCYAEFIRITIDEFLDNEFKKMEFYI